MSDLTTLVNETTQIKTDLISTRDTFKTKMTSKGFDTSSVNTISGLVNLTDTLSNTRWESGNGTVFKEDKNSVNYQCSTEYKLLRTMDLNNIDLKGVNIGSIKANVNFQNGSYTNSQSFWFYVKAEIVDKNGSIIQTKSVNGYYSKNDFESQRPTIVDLNMNLSSIEEDSIVKVYGKIDIDTYWIRINSIKISADLKVGNNVVPTFTGKKWAQGRTLTFKEGGANAEVLEITNLMFTPSIVLAWNKETRASSYPSSSILFYYNKLSANAVTDTIVSSSFTYLTNYNDSDAFSPGNRIGTVYIDKVYKTGSYVFDGKARLVTNQFYQQRYLDWIAFE